MRDKEFQTLFIFNIELNHLKPKKYKYVWNECDKSFTFSKDLYKHKINEHNRGHSYQCFWFDCDQTFTH
jgi:hypothetical protein